MYASCSLQLLHVHLPFYDHVFRQWGMTATSTCPLFKRSVGQGQVYDGLAYTFVTHSVVCEVAVNYIYQTMLVYDFFPVHSICPFCGPWVPAWAVHIEVSHEHHAIFPLPHNLLPAHLPRWILSWPPYSPSVDVYNTDHSVSPWVDVYYNDVITWVAAQVSLFIEC